MREGGAELEAREMCAETHMLAHPEGNVEMGLAVDAAAHRVADDVVRRGGAALRGQVVEIEEELLARSVERVFGCRAVLELRVLRRDDLVCPTEEQVPVRARHTEHLGNHRDRDACRYITHEIA